MQVTLCYKSGTIQKHDHHNLRSPRSPFDNEAHLSSGHNDVALSPLGIQQSKEMGERKRHDHFDAIFCSGSLRAYKSAEIGFGTKWPIIQDKRLRECDYGDLTQHGSVEVDGEKLKRQEGWKYSIS